MKKDKSRDRRKSTFERELKIKKVNAQKEDKKQRKRFQDDDDSDEFEE